HAGRLPASAMTGISSLPIALLRASLAIASAAGLIAVATLCGGAALAAVRLRIDDSIERLVITSGVGLGLLSSVTLLLGLAHGFSPWALRFVPLAAIIISALTLRTARPSPTTIPSSQARAPMPRSYL